MSQAIRQLSAQQRSLVLAQPLEVRTVNPLPNSRRTCEKLLQGAQSSTQPEQATLRSVLLENASSRAQGSAARLIPHAATSDIMRTDRSLKVKLALAKGSHKLDFSSCNLHEVPEEVFELEGLEELSLAGNFITQLPEGIGRLTELQRLQMSGNLLTRLPDSICNCTALQGLWLHGNLIEHLPEDIGRCSDLRQISLAGNCLQDFPRSIGAWTALRDLNLSGNKLSRLPQEIGHLCSLTKLSVNGNYLHEIPESIGGLANLVELHLQSNRLEHLPSHLCDLTALKELNAADNLITELPTELAQMQSLTMLWLYGNQLHLLPAELARMPLLQSLWAEGNPMHLPDLQGILSELLQHNHHNLRDLGLDTEQLEGLDEETIRQIGPVLRIGRMSGHGHGYFKLQKGIQLQLEDTHEQADHAAVADQLQPEGHKTLVVTFGSAPGVPNWGGLLKRLVQQDFQRHHLSFDILYVVDGARMWYNGGCLEEVKSWKSRLKAMTDEYERVMFLGDSMGATAALLFAEHATCVHAFSPQVDLSTSSIRPGRDIGWLRALKDNALAAVDASQAEITVHSSNWQHDLDQARMLPAERVRLEVYGNNSHRLAIYLDGEQKLLPLVRTALLKEMGHELDAFDPHRSLLAH